MLSSDNLKNEIIPHIFAVINSILKDITPNLAFEYNRLINEYNRIYSLLTDENDKAFFKNHFNMLTYELQYQAVYTFTSGINVLMKNNKIEYESYNHLLMVSGLTFINLDIDFTEISKQYTYDESDKNFNLYNDFTNAHKIYNTFFATEAFKQTEYIINQICRIFN